MIEDRFHRKIELGFMDVPIQGMGDLIITSWNVIKVSRDWSWKRSMKKTEAINVAAFFHITNLIVGSIVITVFTDAGAKIFVYPIRRLENVVSHPLDCGEFIPQECVGDVESLDPVESVCITILSVGDFRVHAIRQKTGLEKLMAKKTR
jgi:hypothetical protein